MLFFSSHVILFLDCYFGGWTPAQVKDKDLIQSASPIARRASQDLCLPAPRRGLNPAAGAGPVCASQPSPSLAAKAADCSCCGRRVMANRLRGARRARLPPCPVPWAPPALCPPRDSAQLQSPSLPTTVCPLSACPPPPKQPVRKRMADKYIKKLLTVCSSLDMN